MNENRDMRTHGATTATVGGAAASELATNKVLRNTYMLLAMTLAFSAVMAYVSNAMGFGMPNVWLMLGGMIGLMVLVNFTANSIWGLPAVFAFTGFVGFMIGPLLGAFGQAGQGDLVMQALGTTAVAFVGLSAYALISKKDFSFMSGFLVVGGIVLMAGVVASLIWDIGAARLAISGGFVLFSSCLILWQTSAIIHGGERNYIQATVSLYLSIYNLFMSLLHIFGVMDD